MNKLLNRSLRSFIIYAALVLAASIPVYYLAINILWKYEMSEHHIVLTPEAGREDRMLIVGAVTLLTVLFFILLLVGFILLNRSISNRLWRPFYNSLARIKDFSLQQTTPVQFEKTGIEEFAQLNESLQKLITGNIAVYSQQKEFAENASHELQTPLAVVQSKLELLLQSEPLLKEQYTMIEEALTALSRVSRVNKNLLLLARIENSQFMEQESVDISLLLESLLSPFASIAIGRQITIRPVIYRGVQLLGNPILIEIMISNLVVNAIRHSAVGSEVSLNLSPNHFVVTNPGNQSLNTQQLFKRFASAASQQPGTGLGLALVKQICQRYHWRIEYAFADGMHAFSLHF